MPFDEPTVPMLSVIVCEARPELADHGTVNATLPDAGDAPLTLASVPSVLNASVPWAIGFALLMLDALPW